jgi:outer membrane protein TolC
MKSALTLLCLLLGFAPAVAFAADAAPPDAPATLTLAEVIASIRNHHPALVAARASADAATARIDQEKAWMDPRVGLSLNRADTALKADTNNPGKINEVEVMVSQEVPLSGRPRLRARAASAEAGVASAQATRREWMLLNEARTTFTRLAAADARLAVNTRLRANLDQTRHLARQAYENGLRPQSELLALDTELAKLDAERADLDGLRGEEAARLNALLLRPAATAIPALELPPPAEPVLSLPEAVARARALSPDLAVALREADAARAKLAVVQKNRAIDPEFSVTARRMRGSGDVVSSYDTSVSFSISWANPGRTRAELAEARARISAARAEVEAGEAGIAGMVASAHTRATTTYAQVRRYESELLPLARASADAARRDYEAGREPLVAVLAARRMILETELKLVDFRAEHALAAAELCFLSGQDVQP